ncbi:hypothetical protein ciss_04620 [Carboxydothermus islandicus]|uniref:Probable endonuclease 4 n=1 Tax=Carboxydothermus islandicus TaxID=661089 RepID=A0A1L8D073_9THEO|nr:deoxyribonuclease IV [Carboxydothermus islandicus]GAV24529.1 hypothetical protein ciss_04620 [Carboxydothermus islandicus]
MNVGLHLSIAGGLLKLKERILKNKTEGVQIFSRSPRGGEAKPFNEKELKGFLEFKEEYKLYPLVVHVPYVMNLASPDEEMFQKSVAMIREDLYRSDQLKADFLVVHVGSHRGAGEERGLARMVEGLKILLSENFRTRILIENTAGSGNEMGYSIDHLAYIISETGHEELGICLDTCHLLAAGYDDVSPEGIAAFSREFKEKIGEERFCLLHVNDSKHPIGSRKDRHENLEQGYIGREGFINLLNSSFFNRVPWVLETPEPGIEEDLVKLKKLREEVLKIPADR